MWIGYPGRARELRNPARGVVKAPAFEPAEHVGLSGSIHTTSRPKMPRRWSISLPWLAEADADHLDTLARRVYGPGPFVLTDPSTRNYLAPRQSVARGEHTQWDTDTGSIYTADTGDNSWTHPGAGMLWWVHPVWARWPTQDDWQISFAHDGEHPAQLDFYDAAGTLLATQAAADSRVTATTPAGAHWVTPAITTTAGGETPIPGACLRYHREIGTTWPVGEHVAAVTILNPQRLVEKLPNGSVTLDLLEML